MAEHPDGSEISSYFSLQNIPTGSSISSQGMVIVIGQVVKVHYTDESSNSTKSYVEYDVVIKDKAGGLIKINNLRQASSLGGTNDYDNTILEPCDFAFTGKLDTANLFKNKNGTIVFVAFLDGSKEKPFILAAFPHPRKRGTKKSEGISKKGEFRGIEWNINKDGEFILTYQSDRGPDGKFKRSDTGPTVIKIDKEGRFSITDNQEQLIRIDRVSKKIQIVTKENFEIFVGKDYKKAVAANSSIGITGNETVLTNGDRFHSAANHVLTGGGTIKIGSAGAAENLVLGVAFQTLYNNHSHIGNLGIPTGNPLQLLSATELSQKNFTE